MTKKFLVDTSDVYFLSGRIGLHHFWFYLLDCSFGFMYKPAFWDIFTILRNRYWLATIEEAFFIFSDFSYISNGKFWLWRRLWMRVDNLFLGSSWNCSSFAVSVFIESITMFSSIYWGDCYLCFPKLFYKVCMRWGGVFFRKISVVFFCTACSVLALFFKVSKVYGTLTSNRINTIPRPVHRLCMFEGQNFL